MLVNQLQKQTKITDTLFGLINGYCNDKHLFG